MNDLKVEKALVIGLTRQHDWLRLKKKTGAVCRWCWRVDWRAVARTDGKCSGNVGKDATLRIWTWGDAEKEIMALLEIPSRK